MALTTSQAVRAGNGLGGKTFIMSLDDVAVNSAEAVLAEAQTEGFTVAGVEGVATGDHVALQGTATPAITGATLVATFED